MIYAFFFHWNVIQKFKPLRPCIITVYHLQRHPVVGRRRSIKKYRMTFLTKSNCSRSVKHMLLLNNIQFNCYCFIYLFIYINYIICNIHLLTTSLFPQKKSDLPVVLVFNSPIKKSSIQNCEINLEYPTRVINEQTYFFKIKINK